MADDEGVLDDVSATSALEAAATALACSSSGPSCREADGFGRDEGNQVYKTDELDVKAAV